MLVTWGLMIIGYCSHETYVVSGMGGPGAQTFIKIFIHINVESVM